MTFKSPVLIRLTLISWASFGSVAVAVVTRLLVPATSTDMISGHSSFLAGLLGRLAGLKRVAVIVAARVICFDLGDDVKISLRSFLCHEGVDVIQKGSYLIVLRDLT